ncbi:Ubiquitin carboxyl-terminal hydrolase 34 [Tritrichomonas musculus]|uniref:Ubiquitin carboxyl-terminal hydrolase 34 n=1 Tax=Tritrichomonas musculus TaxID=1915356 RepID=A0ABR2JWQ9_9EUKA
MSREIEDIIKEHPDDIPAQIDALSEAAIDKDLHNYYDIAMELHQKAFDLTIQGFQDKLPELLPKYILTYYLKNSSNEKAIHDFKKDFKKLDNGDDIWDKSKKFYIPEIDTTFKKLNFNLKPNFFIQTYFFPELIDYIKSDVELSLDQLLYYTTIAKNCKSGLKSGTLSDLAQACFQKVSKIENYEQSSIRTIDEKKLRDLLTFIRNNLRLGEGKNLDKLENEIAFKFALSPFLSKQFDGLLRFNSNKSFSSSLVSQIQERGIVEHILKSMHQDLASQFATLLSKLWNAGSYDTQILKQYWNLSLSQHSSVLQKFFTPWPDLIYSIPKSKIDDFWELVENTKSFPEPVVTCLQKVANRANNDVKKAVFSVLWNALEDQNKMDFITVLTDYTPTNSDGRSEVIEKCFSLIEKGEDVKFALCLLSHIWKNVDQEKTKSKFIILLDKCKPQADDIGLLFTVMVKMAENYPAPFDHKEIKKMKKLIKPFFNPQNNHSISTFLKSLITIQKGKLFETDELSKILKWVSKDPENVDNSFFSLIMLIFGKINNISNDSSPIQSLELNGIDTLWELLFSSKLPQVSIYFVNLVYRCQDSNAINLFINRCLSKLDSVGSLYALKMLVMKIENPLDLKAMGIKRNIFIPQDRYINVNFDGDFINSLKVLNGVGVALIKSMIARRTNSNESKIVLVKDQQPVEDNHVFLNDERISVSIGASTDPVRVWKKEELPSQILIQPEYFGQLFDLLTSDNHLLAELSLQLLNFLESSPDELRDIQLIERQEGNMDSKIDTDDTGDIETPTSNEFNTFDDSSSSKSRRSKIKTSKKSEKSFFSKSEFVISWDDKFNPENRFILLYRLNLLANLVSHNHKKFIKGFFQTGGFKQLITMLLNSDERSDILFYSIEMLLKASTTFNLGKLKTQIYQEIGIDFAISTLMKIISKFLSDESYDSHSLLVLLTLLDDLVSYHQKVLLIQDDFPRFYEECLFNADSQVRAGINRILAKVPTDQIEEITYNHLEKASEGNCNEFFYLLRNIANNTESPEKLWKLAFKSLQKYLLQPTTNSKLEFEKEEEDQEELQKTVDDLCAKEADETFLCGIFEVFEVLLPRIQGHIPKAKKVIFFILKKVIFNTNRYIPYPYLSFNLLTKLIDKNESIELEIIKFIKEVTSDCPPSSSYPPNLSSTAKLRGLQNLGCTCYLNSSMQQIFRIQNVRDAVLSYKPDSETEPDKDWTAQLCLLWTKLLYAPFHSINTQPFIKNWTGWDGKPINTMEQQDAVEFVQMLLDRIDEKLQDIKPVSNSVQGSILHKLKGISVDFESDSHEKFTTFSLDVNGRSNLQESYDAILIPDTFPHYKASEEIGYIDANSYTSIEQAPTVLIFQLKRFDYDIETMTRKKINSKYEFSFETDIKTILTENQDVAEPTPCVYELCGVVMHTGNAMGGHYYSYCKDEITNEWNCYNDSTVSPLKTENVINNSLGGMIEVNVLDKKTNEWVREKRENMESAYLLIYKKKDREIKNDKKEPICLMSPRMLRAYLKEQKELILRNVTISNDYLHFIESISEDLNDEIVFIFLFENFVQSLSNSALPVTTDSFINIVKKKLDSSDKFSTFFLSKDTELINLLLNSSSVTTRNACIPVINVAIKKVPKEGEIFINKILSQLDFILNNWKNFDQVFQPIYFYVSEIDSNRRDILDSMLSLLNEKIPSKFKDRELEDFLTSVNLSSVFKIILLLILKLNLTDEFLNTIIDETFMNRWFQSSLHTFEFASLITYFLKDNKKYTDQYLKYILQNSKKMSSSTLAAHFSNACTFVDSLSEYRINWFFKKGIPSQELVGYQLSSFISDSANNISSTKNKSASQLLIKKSNLWLQQWLISTEINVRRSCKLFIYSLFPSFKSFSPSTTFGGYPIPPQFSSPNDSENDRQLGETQEEKDNIIILFEKLLDLSKELMNTCKTAQKIKSNNNTNKPSEVYIPTGDYLEILAWCAFYGRLEKNILKNKDLFGEFANFFGNTLSHELKQSSKDLVHFISLFKLDGFFDNKTLSSFLNMASKVPKNQIAKKEFVESMSTMLFPLITPKPKVEPSYNNNKNNNEMIVKSKIVKLSVKECLDDSTPCSRYVYELICSTTGINKDKLNNTSSELSSFSANDDDYDYSSVYATYQSYLYNEEVFERYLNVRSSYYFKVLPALIERNEKFMRGLKSSKCLSKIASKIVMNYSSHLIYAIFEEQTQIFTVLNSYITSFVAQKYKATLLSDPVKAFVSFWRAKELEPVYKKIVDSFGDNSATVMYVKTSIKFLKLLFTSYPSEFNDMALNMLYSKRSDLYEKMNSSLRGEFAELTFDLINSDNSNDSSENGKGGKHHVKQQVNQQKSRILFDDLENLEKNELFDPLLYSIYAQKMSKMTFIDQIKLNNLLINFMEHCDNISMFAVSKVAVDGLSHLKPDERSRMISEWTEKCARLMKAKIDGLSSKISEHDAKVSQAQLSQALNFLEISDADDGLKKIDCNENKMKKLSENLYENKNKEAMEPLAKTLDSCLKYV